MKAADQRGKIMRQREDGSLICPICKRTNTLGRIRPDSVGQRIPRFCVKCKTEYLTDILDGVCVITEIRTAAERAESQMGQGR